MKIDSTITYYGTLLPSGNQDEFPLIRDQLNKRGVNYNELKKNGGVLFFFEKKEFSKLPIEKNTPKGKLEQYLPVDDDSGHSIYKVNGMFGFMM